MRDHAVLAFDVRGRGDNGGRNLASGVVRHRSPQDTPNRRVGWTQKQRPTNHLRLVVLLGHAYLRAKPSRGMLDRGTRTRALPSCSAT